MDAAPGNTRETYNLNSIVIALGTCNCNTPKHSEGITEGPQAPPFAGPFILESTHQIYTMPLPSLTSSDKPSTSETSINPESITNSVSSAMDGANSSSGGSAVAEAKAGLSQTASEASKAADKLYEENIEDEYAKREGGA